MKDKRLRKLIQLCLHHCKIESHRKHCDDERAARGDKNYLEYLDCGHMIMKNINHIKWCKRGTAIIKDKNRWEIEMRNAQIRQIKTRE